MHSPIRPRWTPSSTTPRRPDLIGRRCRIDLSSLVAIDMHVHVEQDGHGRFSLDQELLDASAKYFKSTADRTPTVERLAERYRALSMAAVIFTVDATTALGHPALSSFEIADAAATMPTC